MQNSPAWSAWIADVEKDKNGEPLLVTRYGYVKLHKDGKTYLAAALKEEFDASLVKSGKELHDDVCLGDQTGCITTSACRACNLRNAGDGLWYCFCVS